MKLSAQAVDPRTVARQSQIELRKADSVLESIQWSYPPEDAIKSARSDATAWRGPKRCPVCFFEFTSAGDHATNCALWAVVHRG